MSIFKDIKNFFQPQAEAPQKPASLGQVLKNAMSGVALKQAPQGALVAPVIPSAMPAIRQANEAQNQMLAEARQKKPEIQAGNFFIDIAQAIPRAVATVGMSAGEAVVPEKQYPEPLQASKVLFGERPLKTFQMQTKQAGDIGESMGINKNVSKIAGAPLIIGSTLLDLTGIGGGAKSAITKNLTDDVVEQLIKSQADDVTEKILRDQVKLPEKAIKDLIPKLTSAQNADEVVGAFGLKKIKTANNLIRTQKTQTSETMLPENQNLNQNLSYNNSVQEIDSPVNKIIKALDEAKPLNKKQQALYAKERSQKFAQLMSARGTAVGETGFKKELSSLKGEMTKLDFDSLRNKLSQTDIDSVFDMVRTTNKLGEWEKIDAQKGLMKMFDGKIPSNSELSKLSQVFPKEVVKSLLDKRSTLKKTFSVLQDSLALPRSIMSSLDLSAPMRQGIFMIGKPKEFTTAFGNMFKQFVSEKSYKNAQEQIVSRPTYKAMREARLAITDTGADILNREETFMSKIAEAIPGVRASGRAYTGFLNRLRADTFDNILKNAKAAGVDVTDEKFIKSLGSFINSATGRGSMPKAFESATPVLSSTLFSPRLIASRVNMLNPQFYIKQDPFVRKEMLKTLASTGAVLGSIYGLAKLAGANIGTDPRSADFGKIKVGNTRYDITGGFQQYLKIASQIYSGEIVSSTSGKVMTLGEGYKPMTRFDILQRFFEGKASPVASFIVDLLQGQDALGNKFNMSDAVTSRFIPMMAQDLYDLQKEYPGVKGAVMGVPGIFGVGSQTYGTQQLTEGVDKIGNKSVTIEGTTGLSTDISRKIFGKDTLSPTMTSNIESYYDQMKKMEPTERTAAWKTIAENNPELAKKIKQVEIDRQKGITVNDRVIKQKGVENGDRAEAIYKKINELETPQQKTELWNDYVKKGIITKEVATQLKQLIANKK